MSTGGKLSFEEIKRKEKKENRKEARDREFNKKATLNMNSLMDIFVNVLIYLMMNYSTSPVDITQSSERTLPKSTTTDPLKDAITIGVTKRSILVNRGKVCDVRDGRVDPSLKKDKQASSYMILPLFEKLKEAATKKKKLAKYSKSVKFKGIVMIVADENMPFRLLSEIMYTAGQAEFGKFKFAVVKKGGG